MSASKAYRFDRLQVVHIENLRILGDPFNQLGEDYPRANLYEDGDADPCHIFH